MHLYCYFGYKKSNCSAVIKIKIIKQSPKEYKKKFNSKLRTITNNIYLHNSTQL